MINTSASPHQRDGNETATGAFRVVLASFTIYQREIVGAGIVQDCIHEAQNRVRCFDSEREQHYSRFGVLKHLFDWSPYVSTAIRAEENVDIFHLWSAKEYEREAHLCPSSVVFGFRQQSVHWYCWQGPCHTVATFPRPSYVDSTHTVSDWLCTDRTHNLHVRQIAFETHQNHFPNRRRRSRPHHLHSRASSSEDCLNDIPKWAPVHLRRSNFPEQIFAL